MWLCSFTADRTCAPNKFQCPNSGVCLNEVMVCDGWNNCGDNSDEQNCGSSNASVFKMLLLPEFLSRFDDLIMVSHVVCIEGPRG